MLGGEPRFLTLFTLWLTVEVSTLRPRLPRSPDLRRTRYLTGKQTVGEAFPQPSMSLPPAHPLVSRVCSDQSERCGVTPSKTQGQEQEETLSEERPNGRSGSVPSNIHLNCVFPKEVTYPLGKLGGRKSFFSVTPLDHFKDNFLSALLLVPSEESAMRS